MGLKLIHMEKKEGNLKVFKDQGRNQCLSCGTAENLGRKRYCSKECRRELFRRLQILAGLLRALRTKYAAFSFTESLLVLDIRPQGSKKVYRFHYQRSLCQKPAQDLFNMTDELGNLWWDKKRQTGKRYRASQYLLENAIKDNIPPDSVIPLEIKSPVCIAKSLTSLKLTNEDLKSSKPHKAIKSAYRKEALKHHPDRGGDSESFRKINNAYQELVNWLKSPTLRIRKGIPCRWCFDGKKWKTPLPFPMEIASYKEK